MLKRMGAGVVNERVYREVLVLDGAMGTNLQARGLPRSYPPDLWSIERPDEIRQLHKAYVDAGADIILTNTFGASRLHLDRYGWGERVSDLNRAAVRLAREAVEGTAFVAGDIGPCGPSADTFHQLPRSRAFSIFAEQIEALAFAGVDLLAIETISDLEEMRVAVSAARSVAPDLPILALLTFTREAKLRSGEEPALAARALHELGVDIVGANCSSGFESLLPICEEMARSITLPVAMKPSAGVPPGSLVTADKAAEYARRLVQAGASLVGGCCGVGPDTLRAIALAVKDMVPIRHPAVASYTTRTQGLAG